MTRGASFPVIAAVGHSSNGFWRGAGLALALCGLLAVPVREVSCGESGDATNAHPLAGRIWSSSQATFIDSQQLRKALAGADFLLLGEVHDNVHHHQQQAQLVGAFVGEPQSVTVGFEQLDTSQAAQLAQYLRENPRDAAGLGEALDWSGSGWPDWSLYQPVFQQVLERGWRPVPLMFPAGRSREIMEQGFAAVLDEQALARLQPDTALTAAQKSAMTELMRIAHCDKLPEQYIPGMVEIQIARDAHMAWALLESGKRGIFIVGDGHARKDWGIPLFLRKIRPAASISVVSMVEVEADLAAPADYPQVAPSYSDYVVFTPRQERDDPCATISP